ncbi:MAG: hypothetical protein U0893_15575 [Chloroflexota bacterium]
MDGIITWLVRSLHVFGAAVWLGGYAVMLIVVVPYLSRERNEPLRALAITTCRVLSWAGAVTVLAGLLLIWRTRGYGFLLAGEWGGIVIVSFVLAFILGALGDAVIKPRIRRLDPGKPETVAAVRRWVAFGLGLGIVTLLLMTRAIYAPT